MAKILIDIQHLREEGKISAEEFERLAALAPPKEPGRGINIMTSIGLVVLLSGILALFPSAATAFLLGLGCLGFGFFLHQKNQEQTEHLLLVHILAVLGNGLLTAAILFFSIEKLTWMLLLAAIISFGNAFIFRNALLLFTALTFLSGFASFFPDWELAKDNLFSQPTGHILGFSVLLLLGFFIPWGKVYQNLRQAFFYGCLFFINLAFFVGTFSGDTWEISGQPLVIADHFFSALWALLLAIGIFLALFLKNQGLFNFFVAFASLHFYVQFFRQLGFSAEVMVLAGLLGLALAFVLTRLNRQFFDARRQNV
jgi:hypothetical protein